MDTEEGGRTRGVWRDQEVFEGPNGDGRLVGRVRGRGWGQGNEPSRTVIDMYDGVGGEGLGSRERADSSQPRP